MSKWSKRVLFAVICAGSSYVAYGLYDGYRAGYHTRPDMPEGAFSISYKNGMRAVLVDVPNERDTRRYLGFPAKVPFYLESTWSFCYPPSEKEGKQFASLMKKRKWPGERFEAVCRINVDDEVVVRGVITSVPKL